MTKLKENLHVQNPSHGIVDTEITTEEILKVFLCISVVKNVVTYDSVYNS
jgi:hypothetical protein